MMSETSSSSHGLEQITDRTTHDAAIDLAADTTAKPNPNPTPIVIYVTSSAQSSSTNLTAQITKLAASDEFATGDGKVRFFQMEMTKDTTPMIKFGPQNCPLFIFMRGRYCETEYGRIGVEGVRERCRRMVAMGQAS